MTFEEFFKKKKINLITFEQGEPALFSEFKIHYEQMGEKSFDHTKKYWFNKLRLRFPAPPEIKVEKVAIENTLAEQTITESLIESSPPADIGFKPKFKAGVTKPAKEVPQPEKKAQNPTPPNVGFKPRFKAGVTKAAEPTSNTEPKPVPENPVKDTEQTTPPAALGFKPKFKVGVTKSEQKEESKTDEPSTENNQAKPAYKPRFNMKNVKPKEKE